MFRGREKPRPPVCRFDDAIKLAVLRSGPRIFSGAATMPPRVVLMTPSVINATWREASEAPLRCAVGLFGYPRLSPFADRAAKGWKVRAGEVRAFRVVFKFTGIFDNLEISPRWSFS